MNVSKRLPTVKKGDVVVCKPRSGPARRMTADEVKQWYATYGGMGDDGESRVLVHQWVEVKDCGPLTVTKARAQAPSSKWGTAAVGWSEVVTEDGQVLLLDRRNIMGVSC